MFTNPVRGPRIVPFGSARTAADVLPNGRPAFRVTQRYADTDIFFGGRHNAIDIGNFYCGDELLAMAPGRVSTRQDTYGALIAEIDHGNGYVTGYGHLRSFTVVSGSVTGGERIGYVGDTGLGGVCHCHVYVRKNGVLIDPWPLLYQNISAPVAYRRLAGAGINIRYYAGTASAIYATSYATGIKRNGVVIAPLNAVMRYGGSVTVAGSKWERVWIGNAYRSVRADLLRTVT